MADDLSRYGVVSGGADDLSKYGTISTPDKPEASDSGGFWNSLGAQINPIPAIKEWFTGEGPAGQAQKALHVLNGIHEEAAKDPANKGKPVGQWKLREPTPEEQTVLDRGMTAHLRGPEGNIASDMGQPAITAGRQAIAGDVPGAVGTLVGGYGVPAAVGAGVGAIPEGTGAALRAGVKGGVRAGGPDIAIGAGKLAAGAAVDQLPLPSAVKYGVMGGAGLEGGRQLGRGVVKGGKGAYQAWKDSRAARQAPTAAPAAAPAPAAPTPMPPSRQIGAAPRVFTPDAPPDTSGPIPTDPKTGYPVREAPEPANELSPGASNVIDALLGRLRSQMEDMGIIKPGYRQGEVPHGSYPERWDEGSGAPTVRSTLKKKAKPAKSEDSGETTRVVRDLPPDHPLVKNPAALLTAQKLAELMSADQ